MKTEINIENKAKFFAYYLGQRVWIKPSVYGYDTFTVTPEMLYGPTDEQYLQLKPLSSITDEDFKSLGIGKNKKEFLDENTTGDCIEQLELDYLRSKGYALPWMGLLVENMVEAGWIKLLDK